MKYFWIVLLVVTSVQAAPDKFLYEGTIYEISFDFYDDFSPGFWSECRHDTVSWRLYRSQDKKDRPWAYAEEYMTATSCDRRSLAMLVHKLKMAYPTSDYQSVGFANFLTAYVNSFFYHKENNNPGFGEEETSYQNPNETIYGSGDCEDLALLLTGLMSYSCMNTAFIVGQGHAYTSCTIGSEGVSRPVYVEKNGRKYYVVEAVGCGGTRQGCSPWKLGEESDAAKGDIKHMTLISGRNCN